MKRIDLTDRSDLSRHKPDNGQARSMPKTEYLSPAYNGPPNRAHRRQRAIIAKKIYSGS